MATEKIETTQNTPSDNEPYVVPLKISLEHNPEIKACVQYYVLSEGTRSFPTIETPECEIQLKSGKNKSSNWTQALLTFKDEPDFADALFKLKDQIHNLLETQLREAIDTGNIDEDFKMSGLIPDQIDDVFTLKINIDENKKEGLRQVQFTDENDKLVKCYLRQLSDYKLTGNCSFRVRSVTVSEKDTGFEVSIQCFLDSCVINKREKIQKFDVPTTLGLLRRRKKN